MPAVPTALHIYQGPNVWLTSRDGAGVWSLSQYFGDAKFDLASTGFLTDANPLKYGVLMIPSSTLNWYGSGSPDTPLAITVSNAAGGDGAPYFDGYWNCSAGAWWINGAWYALLGVRNFAAATRKFAMLKSTAYEGGDPNRPTTWEEQHQAGSPTTTDALDHGYGSALRWDGNSTKVDVLTKTAAGGTEYKLYTYDLDTDTWSAGYGSVNIGTAGQVVYCGDGGSWGNGIFRYPNDDIGIIYSYEGSNSIYYRLYVSATSTWGSEETLATYSDMPTLGTVIPDPARESLHVFVNNGYTAGYYHIVTHSGPHQADLFEFSCSTVDKFGNGLVYDGKLMVPYDSATENLIWVAPITGGATTFVAETLPRPDGTGYTGPYPESSHPYTAHTDETQVFTWPGATALFIDFNGSTNVTSGLDYIYIYDGSDNPIGQVGGYTGTALAGQTIMVPGDTVKIRLDGNGDDTLYGYGVAIGPGNDTGAPSCSSLFYIPQPLPEPTELAGLSMGTSTATASLLVERLLAGVSDGTSTATASLGAGGMPPGPNDEGPGVNNVMLVMTV